MALSIYNSGVINTQEKSLANIVFIQHLAAYGKLYYCNQFYFCLLNVTLIIKKHKPRLCSCCILTDIRHVMQFLENSYSIWSWGDGKHKDDWSMIGPLVTGVLFYCCD